MGFSTEVQLLGLSTVLKKALTRRTRGGGRSGIFNFVRKISWTLVFPTCSVMSLPYQAKQKQNNKLTVTITVTEPANPSYLVPCMGSISEALFRRCTSENKFDFGATLARRLIQTAHRVSSPTKVRQTLSNLTLLPHQTKTAVPDTATSFTGFFPTRPYGARERETMVGSGHVVPEQN